MDVTIHQAMLPHTDPDASLASYRDLLAQEPTDQPYGQRGRAVRDPAGTLVRIQQVDA